MGILDNATTSTAASGADAENQTTTTTTAADTMSSKMRSLFPDLAVDGEEEATYAPKTPIAAFRHKAVRLFQVGQFTFYDGILYIYSDEELEEFAKLYTTLGGPDKVNIVAYNWEAAAQLESDASSAIRGMLTTRGIKDPKTIR